MFSRLVIAIAVECFALGGSVQVQAPAKAVAQKPKAGTLKKSNAKVKSAPHKAAPRAPPATPAAPAALARAAAKAAPAATAAVAALAAPEALAALPAPAPAVPAAPTSPAAAAASAAGAVQAGPAAAAPAAVSPPVPAAPAALAPAAAEVPAPVAAAPAPAPNATLTAEQSAALKAATACGADANASFTKVLGAVAVVNSSAVTFLDSVTAAVNTAHSALNNIQGSTSSILRFAGIDDTFLSDFVTQIGEKISDTMVTLNETNTELRTSLADVLGDFRAEREMINESLAAAVASTRQGLLASAAQTQAAAAANASETFLLAKHSANVAGPKAAATIAIATVNATADRLMEMLSQLNATLLATLMDDVVVKVNSSARKMQSALASGEEKFPSNVPGVVTDKVDALFDVVFAAIDAIKPSEVNSQLEPMVQESASEVTSLQGCIAPLNVMVEDLEDGASLISCSWLMLAALLAFTVSRSVLQ